MMESIFLFAIGLAGIVLRRYVLFKNRKNKNKPFSGTLWVRRNLAETMVSIAIILIGIFVKDEIVLFLENHISGQYPRLTIFGLGFAGSMVLDFVVEFGNKLKKVLHG